MAVFYIAVALMVALLLSAIHRRYNDPLRKFPGPYLASWTYLWRLRQTIVGAARIPYAVELHHRYGDVVRTGPNVLNFSDPQAIKDIYGADKPYPRSDWYWTFATTAQGRVNQTLFATTNTEWHDNLKRAVNPAFSLSALVSYEPYVNSTVTEYLHQLEQRYADKPGPEGIIDLPVWMQWYAFDVVGELTYGNPFGFLKTGSDVDDIIKNSNNFMRGSIVYSAFPGLDRLLRKNPIIMWLNRQGYFSGKPNPVVSFALKNRANRSPSGCRLDLDNNNSSSSSPDDRADLIYKFIQSKEKYPETITEREVLGMSLSMIFAGSESTGTTLTAILYYILKHPRVYRKLRTEIDSVVPASARDLSENTPVPFKVAFTQLPYLEACMKEVFRIHPAARFAPERVLPPSPSPGGTYKIAGHDVPGGTVVGVNAWAVHRREDVFGEGTEFFRPERWLAGEGDEEKARVEKMGHQLNQFGAGKFACIGRNISLMEMYKLVPSLLRRFEFELVDPEKELTLAQGGFVNIEDVNVRVKGRKVGEGIS